MSCRSTLGQRRAARRGDGLAHGDAERGRGARDTRQCAGGDSRGIGSPLDRPRGAVPRLGQRDLRAREVPSVAHGDAGARRGARHRGQLALRTSGIGGGLYGPGGGSCGHVGGPRRRGGWQRRIARRRYRRGARGRNCRSAQGKDHTSDPRGPGRGRQGKPVGGCSLCAQRCAVTDHLNAPSRSGRSGCGGLTGSAQNVAGPSRAHKDSKPLRRGDNRPVRAVGQVSGAAAGRRVRVGCSRRWPRPAGSPRRPAPTARRRR